MFALAIVVTELREKLRKRPTEWPTLREWTIVIGLDLMGLAAGFIAGFIVGGAV